VVLKSFGKNPRQRAAVLTLPDSICWLLNIRGGDVARTPILRAARVRAGAPGPTTPLFR